MPTPGQPVVAMALLGQKPDKVASGVPILKSLVLLELANRGSVLGSRALEADNFLLNHQGPYAPQGRTPLLPKLSVTSKVSAPTSYAWVGSLVHFRSSEDVTVKIYFAG